MKTLYLAAGLAVVAAAPLRAQNPSDTVQLRHTIEQTLSGYKGTVGVSVRNLATGEHVSLLGDQTFPTASLIKISVLVTLMDEVNKGHVGLDERVGLINRDKVGGTGVLQYLSSGTMPTMEDLAWLMITLSDNTATNLLLNKLDIRTVGLKMESLGLPHSKIFAKVFHRETSIAPDSSKLYGLGVTTPDEMTQLLSLMYQGKAVSPALDSLALRMMTANQDGSMMVRWLPENVRVAHKTGSVDRSRTDCGIIYSPAAPLDLCVLTKNNQDTTYVVDNAAHRIIGRVARDVFHHFNPSVPLPALPEVPPGSG